MSVSDSRHEMIAQGHAYEHEGFGNKILFEHGKLYTEYLATL